MTRRILLAGVVAAAFAAPALGQPLPEPSNGLTLGRLMSYPVINGRSPNAPTMSPDGTMISFGWNKTGERMLDLWVMDYPSGETRQIVKAVDIPKFPRQDDTRTELEKTEEELYDGGISGATWSPDSNELLFSYRGRIWRVKPAGGAPVALVDAQMGMYAAAYSPDGHYIAYQQGSNVYRLDRRTGAIKQLTFVSQPRTAVDGLLWSPDSKRIAVSWSDSSRLGSHQMMDFSKDRAEVVNIQRMWQGDLSQNMQIGFINAEGGVIKFAEGIPRYVWMTSWDWSPDSSRLAIDWTSDDFQESTITVLNPDSPYALTAYHETAPSNYIPDFRQLFWKRDGSAICFTTDIINGRWANRSLMQVSPYGGPVTAVYAKDHDIAAAGRPKESDRIILVTQKRSPLKAEITILEPNGDTTTHVPLEDGMATPTQFDDMALPLYSDSGKEIATIASSRTKPRELWRVEPGRMAKLTNSTLPEFEKVQWANYEEVSFPGPDGKMIHGVLITKPGLDRSKKHPAFISSMYANSGKMSWNGYFENYAAMELDMVVLQVDFRASWGYGGEFNSGYFEKMGIIDSDEAVKAKEYLVSTGYVNPDRCGVWGWSYGGYLTCMIMLTEPGVFDTGVAVASVTDWQSYNEWYTRRRLGQYSENKEIYEATSPIYHADGLDDEANLLLIHGMLDDNVLYQDTVRLEERMIENGKFFDSFEYPRGDHGMWRVHERPHVFETIMRYLYHKLNRP